jgi:Fe-S-cluster containining protein
MINNLPGQTRRTLLRNITVAGRKILSASRSTVEKQNSGSDPSSDSLVELSRWYAQINLACPYIENKLCRYYAERPLVCREFMVLSPPARCVPGVADERVIVDLPIRMSEVLMEASAKLTGTNPQAMFLPLVPAWYEDVQDLQNKYFDARHAAEILIETILENRQRKMVQAAEHCQSSVSD